MSFKSHLEESWMWRFLKFCLLGLVERTIGAVDSNHNPGRQESDTQRFVWRFESRDPHPEGQRRLPMTRMSALLFTAHEFYSFPESCLPTSTVRI